MNNGESVTSQRVEQECIELEGSIEKILFSNPQNGYTVCSVVLASCGTSITACGTFSGVANGSKIKMQGTWTRHAKFGKQFAVMRYTVYPPSSAEGIEKYLSSGLVKGIGPAYAKKLVSFFGAKTLEVIDKTPELLSRVQGIGAKRQEEIVKAWIEQKEVAHIMVFLQEKGVSATYAAKIYKTYRNRSIELIMENPYRLAEDVWGIGFSTADAIAQKLSVAHDSVKRCRAGILHVISVGIQHGHVYVEVEHLKNETIKLLGIDQENARHKIRIALHELYESKKIKLLSPEEGQHFITLSSHYATEYGIALRIKELKEAVSGMSNDTHALYEQLRTDRAIAHALNEDQQRGVMSVFADKFTIITGGPGTGKTTLVKAIITLCDSKKIAYKLAAPTGRAAKKLAQSTQRYAFTIHRLLEFDPATMQFSRNSMNAIDCSLLIVDESSMIDIFLMHALLKAVSNTAHVVLIGDVDQLPSVGCGNVLADLIESKIIPTVRLTHIFRQAHESLIVTNAHRINKGEFFITHEKEKQHIRDFYFIKEDEPERLADHLKHIFSKVLKEKYISAEHAVVLAPMNKGSAGVVTLNHTLQPFLNREDGDAISYGVYVFRKGDRVMQIRNNYDKNVFNGDSGAIVTLDKQAQKLIVQFDRAVEYAFGELDELVLAYALSIHKSQGSEYDAVIIPFFMQHFTLLQRTLLYTAVTRAKKLCILIGQPKAFLLAIKNHSVIPRVTFLKEFLSTSLSAR